jgi:putative phosphoribosyl transferase
MRAQIFANRDEAGRLLADAMIEGFGDLGIEHPVVLALPRGGVPVAAPVAKALKAPLDLIIVRKIGVPTQPEVAMGAIGEDGAVVRDEHLLSMLGISDAAFDNIMLSEMGELERKADRYRRNHAMIDINGRDVIIVDDGIATGSTALAAVKVARARGAAHVVVATPVCSPEARRLILYEVDDLFALQTPEQLLAVGYYYDDFHPTPDEEVERILAAATAAA